MVEAARKGDTATITRLTTLGISPSPVGSEEHVTPLGAAAQAGHTDMVILLLRKGARVNERDDQQQTAFTVARQVRHADIVQLLKDAGGHE